MLIQAAINGSRKKGEHPALPVSPEEVARSAAECVAAGAGAIHLHVRGADGGESLAAGEVARTVDAVRARVGEVAIGVSTGAWILRDVRRRLEAVGAWTVLPDMASVNFGEEGSVELARRLVERGMGVEAGLFDAEAAEILAASGLAGRCLRILLEPSGETMEAALGTLSGIEKVLGRAVVRLPRLLHGLGATAWPLIDVAIARGYDTRVGFEDTLTLPDGSLAPSNAALVAATLARCGR